MSAGVIGSAATARACARAGRVRLPAANAPASVVDAWSNCRLDSRTSRKFFLRELRRPTSYPKQSAVVRLDLLARSFDAGGVLLDGLDVAERRATRFLLDQRMHRAQGAEIDDELLTFGRKAIALEKA